MTTDAQILTALRKVSGGSVSGAELSQRLGVSRAAIWARIEALRELGYDIEASPHLGYRLLNAPDVLHADDLTSPLLEACMALCAVPQTVRTLVAEGRCHVLGAESSTLH